MPPSAPALLEDDRRAAVRIGEVTSGRVVTDYSSDDFLRAAVERWFIVIGESLGRLEKVDPGVIGQISDYRKIIGFRNVLVQRPAETAMG